MSKIAMLLSVILSFTFATAGELIVKIPTGATVYLEGKQDLRPGDTRVFIVDDSQLIETKSYEFHLEIVSNGVSVKRTVEYPYGGSITVDFRNEFPRPGRGDAEPTVAAPNDQTPKKNAVPYLIKRNEHLNDLYLEYLENSTVLDKKELHLDDPKKYRCSVWDIATSNNYDRELVLDATNTGGARAVHMRLTDPLADKKEDYLLVKKPNGWRGTRTEKGVVTKIPVSAREIAIHQGATVSGPVGISNGFADGYYGRVVEGSYYVNFLVPGANVEYRSEKAICFTANKDNPSEIYLELSRKITLGYMDGQGKEIDVDVNPKVGLKISSPVGYLAYPLFSFTSIFASTAFEKEGNHSLPASYCYRDLQTDPLVAYRMQGIGFCTLEESR